MRMRLDHTQLRIDRSQARVALRSAIASAVRTRAENCYYVFRLGHLTPARRLETRWLLIPAEPDLRR
jgi:hypothetical protein